MITSTDIPTAGVLVIGDEILSGRTKDRNVGTIADVLSSLGIDLEEVRIVADRKEAIVGAVRALSARYTIVLTTGGIGPTHDDITAQAIADAFGVPLDLDPRAVAILTEHYSRIGRDLNEARLRMARVPRGGELIRNPVSAAPGFSIGNVYVLAGVPDIMQAMLGELAPRLPRSATMASETVEAGRPEGDFADMLAALQDAHPDVKIGSYPYHDGARFNSRLVLRGRDRDALARARMALENGLKSL